MKKIDNKNKSEPHKSNHNSKLNWLRASVLGANDGIVSIAGLVAGVAGATESKSIILMAGVAGIIAGAISMAAGEYISVSSSRDTERALLNLEKDELDKFPERELEELISMYEHRGLSRQTAVTAAKELTDKDAYSAHVEIELGIDPNNLTNPWHAAFASCLAFLSGAVIPLAAVLIPPSNVRIPFAFGSVVLALIITGTISAKIGGANIKRAIVRVVSGGVLAMAVTYFIGRAFGILGV